MEYLEEISVSDLKVFEPWTLAPVGTLLQGHVNGQQTVGLRCAFATVNGSEDGIVIVAGKNVGKFAGSDTVSGPAFDISGLVEIVAKPGPPRKPRSGAPPGLLLCKGKDYFIWIETLTGGGAGFIDIQTGEYRAELREEGRIEIAPTIGVRVRSKIPRR